MQIGLIGLPASGKTTLFNLLTNNKFQTGISGNGEVRLGSAAVPDQRINYLAELYKPKKTTYTRIDFKDIPGVSTDDGKARAAHILSEVRSADALVQVLRIFNNEEAEALVGQPKPYQDLVDYGSELLLADMALLEKRIQGIEQSPKASKESLKQLDLFRRMLDALENEQLIGNMSFAEGEKELLKGLRFLTEKPLFLVLNIDEEQLRKGEYPDRKKIMTFTAEKNIPLVEICARAEMEINCLESEEQLEFLEDLGLEESGLNRLTRMVYDKLNLISFFTVGEDEVKAWTIEKGAPARQAAGKIHSDISRGFIRAEVFNYNHLFTLGSAAKVREAGHFRLEGKDYQVQDGDIASFRFNV